jgi:hypothetical protein
VGKNPDHGVLGGLAETSPYGGVLAFPYGVDGHARDGEVALLLGEPPGVVREVGEEEETKDGDDEGDDTLEDEKPLPSWDASDVAQSVEDTRGDETGESSGEDVTGVENGNARGDLLTVVEHWKQIHGTRVIWSLCHTKEEACEKKAFEVLSQGGQGRYDSPEHHARAHVAWRTRAVQEHVGGDLAEEIAHEQDWHAGLILSAREIEVLFKIVETGKGDGVAVEIVEPVHGPKHGHDPAVEFLHEGNFSGVGFLKMVSSCLLWGMNWETNLVSTRVIDLGDSRYRLLWVVIVGSWLLEHDNPVFLLVDCHDDFVCH